MYAEQISPIIIVLYYQTSDKHFFDAYSSGLRACCSSAAGVELLIQYTAYSPLLLLHLLSFSSAHVFFLWQETLSKMWAAVLAVGPECVAWLATVNNDCWHSWSRGCFPFLLHLKNESVPILFQQVNRKPLQENAKWEFDPLLPLFTWADISSFPQAYVITLSQLFLCGHLVRGHSVTSAAKSWIN